MRELYSPYKFEGKVTENRLFCNLCKHTIFRGLRHAHVKWEHGDTVVGVGKDQKSMKYYIKAEVLGETSSG